MKTATDWGTEIWRSLGWIAWVWPLTFVCFVAVAFLLVRLTQWGRQFWRISSGFFTGSEARVTWTYLAVLLLSVVAGVRLTVVFSYYYFDIAASIQAISGSLAKDKAGMPEARAAFWHAIQMFIVLAIIHVARMMLDVYILQAFIIRWRVWLTDRITTNWLDGRAFYRSRFIDSTIDNPDQRIQADINNFVAMYASPETLQTSGGHLAFGAAKSVISLVSFTIILWQLSGTMNIFGVTVPYAMVWLAYLYVIIGTLITFWIGHPLIRLYFLNERLNAMFRYALVRLRDTAESVAFYRGERAEARQLKQRFDGIIANYWRLVGRGISFTGWNLSVTQAAAIFAYVIQGPRLMAGEISYGALSQSSNAFGQVHDNLSFFRNAYDTFASYRATVNRLDGLLQANEQSRELPSLDPGTQDEGVTLENVYVRKPNGDVLIDDVNLELNAGDALVIKGSSGGGKTTLLRSLAQLWPYADGHWSRPGGEHETMFVSQLPYIPLGNLRDALSYPAESGTFSDDELSQILEKVSLAHLVDRLDEESDWIKVLSPGEQQRVAFARILLIKPKVVFMDESTSALDEGLEFALYRLVRTEVPECTVVSVSHRSTVDQHHTQKLELVGEGRWELSPIGTGIGGAE